MKIKLLLKVRKLVKTVGQAVPVAQSNTEFNKSLGESTVICGAYAKCFETENTFNEHLHNHTLEDLFKCTECEEEVFLKTEVDLEWHKEAEHGCNTKNTSDGVEEIVPELDKT